MSQKQTTWIHFLHVKHFCSGKTFYFKIKSDFISDLTVKSDHLKTLKQTKQMKICRFKKKKPHNLGVFILSF